MANKLDPDLKMSNSIDEDIKGKNRQELPKYYRLNDAIFLSKVDTLLNTKDWYEEKSYAYIMDSNRALDIDSEIDFYLAELLKKKFKRLNNF